MFKAGDAAGLGKSSLPRAAERDSSLTLTFDWMCCARIFYGFMGNGGVDRPEKMDAHERMR